MTVAPQQTTGPVEAAASPSLAVVARPPKRGANPRLLLALIFGGALLTVGLWWHDTSAIDGVAAWLTNAGRITGLLAGYGVVVLLALMAKVPSVERGVGADRLARWHAMGGRYSVSLISAHALLIIWGYGLTDHHSFQKETMVLLTEYADVLMATAAWGLFLLVGITSARAARRRLRYETWHFVHFYTYLAVALSFSHQFATGADFVDNRPARLAWASLYIFVGYLIVRYRFAAPVVASLRHDLRVERVVREVPGVVSVWISGRDLERMGAEAGQFFRWRFMDRDMWWAANPYSLSAVPNGRRMRITARIVGDHSAALTKLQRGTRVIAEGPFGAMTRARRKRSGVLLVAGGVGITPLRALFEALAREGGDVALIYRASEEVDVIFREELTRIAARHRVRLMFAVGPRGSANDVLDERHLSRLLPDIQQRDVYLCGPTGLMKSARAALKAAGVPSRQIHEEDFDLESQ